MDVLNVDPALSDEELENDDGIQKLVEGLNISDLSSAGTEFAVHVNEDSALEEQTSYEESSVFPHLNLSCLGPEDEESDTETSHDGSTPFTHIAKKMVDLISDGKVKKRILKEGYGEIVPENAVVWFHHNSYIEGLDTPFDSSYLRGHQTMLRLNCGRCIPGLDIGLSTMKVDEKAEFLIHPDYAYGSLGVPPRIPENSYILIQVEMKKFVDNALAMKMGELTEEELKEIPFEEVCKGALSLLQNGKSNFFQKKYQTSIKLYRNGVRILENCNVNSDEDDAKNEALRLKLYTNLGICYNKINRPKQAIVQLQNALRLDRKCAKILYQLGLAHLSLSSFDEAKKFAFLARQNAPKNTEISSLLQKINKKMEMYNTSLVSFAKNAFKFDEKNGHDDVNSEKGTPIAESSGELELNDSFSYSVNNSSGVTISEIGDESLRNSSEIIEERSSVENSFLQDSCNSDIETEFQRETILYIQEFFNDPTEKEIPLPPGLTYEEEIFFRKQASMYDLRMIEKEVGEGKTYMYFVK